MTRQSKVVIIIAFAKKEKKYIITDKIGTKVFCKVRKKAKIRNRYNPITHLAQDTVWESVRNTRKHHIQEIQEVSHFPTVDLKAARKRHHSIAKRNTKEKSHWHGQ